MIIPPEKQMDEHFRDRLEDLEINPPERVWAGIANNLDRAQVNSEKRRVAWLWWFSAVSLVISLTAFAAVFFKGHDEMASKDAAQYQQQMSPNEPVPSDEQDGAIDRGTQDGSGQLAEANSNSSNSSSTYTTQGNYTAKTNSKISVTTASNKQQASPQAPKEDNEEHKTVYHPRNAIRNVDPTFEQQPNPEKQYKLYVAPLTEEMVIAAPAINLIQQPSPELAGTFQPFDDIVYIPGRVVCPKWKVGVTYTYAWTTYRDLKDGDSLGFYQGSNQYLPKYRLTSAHFDSIESKKTGFSKGIALGYRVLPHFTVSTGVDLTQYRWEAHMADAVLVKDPDKTYAVTTSVSTYNTDTINGSGPDGQASILGFTPVPQDPDTVMIEHKFNYISIPLTVSYSVFKPCSKVGLSLNAGISASFLSSYTVTHDGTEKEAKSEYLRNRSMELIAGASVSYAPVRHLSLEVQPVYRRFIQPVNKFQSVRTFPYMWGIQGGVYYKF